MSTHHWINGCQKCLFCSRYLRKDRAAAGEKFCSPAHAMAYALRLQDVARLGNAPNANNRGAVRSEGETL